MFVEGLVDELYEDRLSRVWEQMEVNIIVQEDLLSFLDDSTLSLLLYPLLDSLLLPSLLSLNSIQPSRSKKPKCFYPLNLDFTLYLHLINEAKLLMASGQKCHIVVFSPVPLGYCLYMFSREERYLCDG